MEKAARGTRKCLWCERRKPREEFVSLRCCRACADHPCRDCGAPMGDGYARHRGRRCAACEHARDHARYAAERERVLARNKVWKDANRQPGMPAYERYSKTRKATHAVRRAAVYAHYGGRCACCGESEPLFLTIEHPDGNGNEHRREIKRSSMVDWLYLSGFPPGYAVLCFNCTAGRYRNGGVCPHARAGSPAD